MKDEYKIKLLQYWLDNPDKQLQIPKELKDKVSKECIAKLVMEIEPSKDSIGGTSSIKSHDYFKHSEKLRKN